MNRYTAQQYLTLVQDHWFTDLKTVQVKQHLKHRLKVRSSVSSPSPTHLEPARQPEPGEI